MEATQDSKADEQCPTITVQITATVERDYKRRGVFWKLRLGRADQIVNGATGRYALPLQEAKAVLADAEEQHRAGSDVRGMRKAYSSLVYSLSRAIREEERKGLWDDPGWEVAIARALDSPAQFRPGDRAIYWAEWEGDDRDGRAIEIVGEYKFRRARDKAGPYVLENGERGRYQWGYSGRYDNGETYFFAAHELRNADGAIRHLQVVKP